jgi:hypothetical protein
MQEIKKFAVAATAFLLTSLTGCSNGGAEAVPELPSRICWDAFISKDVKPLLPPGDKVNVYSEPFSLPEQLDGTRCSVDIDGVTKFHLSATHYASAREIDWTTYKEAGAESVDVGDKGLLWFAGGVSYIVCKPYASASDPGKYIHLKLSTYNSRENEKPRATFLKLLKQYVAFARSELNCP